MCGKIHTPFLLRIYAFTLQRLVDTKFMYCFFKKSLDEELLNENCKLLRFTVRNGLAFYLAQQAFDYFFEFITDESNGYDLFHDIVIDDIWCAWENSESGMDLCRNSGDEKHLEIDKLIDFIRLIDLAEDGDVILNSVMECGFLNLCRIVNILVDNEPLYYYLRELYAMEIGDRIIHDREVCYLISMYLVNMFPGRSNTNAVVNITRKPWPSFVKDVLIARDRGKCAICGKSISFELSSASHIDHIFPLSKGGCNDLVNLQFCCADCNCQKGADLIEARSSIPQYHIRKRLGRRNRF